MAQSGRQAAIRWRRDATMLGRLAFVAIAALAVTAAAVVTLRFLTPADSSSPAADPRETIPAAPGVIAFVRSPLPVTSALADTQRVSSADELEAAVSDETTVIIVDNETLSEVDEAFLARTVREGVALVGLNVSNDELRGAVRFNELLRAIGNVAPPGSAGYGPLDQPGYSTIWFAWTSSNSNAWSSGQHYFSDNLFAPTIDGLSLSARGLARDGDGKVVPIDQLDLESFD